VNRSTTAIVITAIVVAVVVGVLATRFGTDPNEVESPLVGTPVLEIELPYLEGDGAVALGPDTGDILIVNFWASWCIPCRAEHPVLVDAAARWESAGVRVVGVVYQDDADSAGAFLDEFGRGYETVRDEGGRAAIFFGVFGIPETFFVDREGKIAGVVRGEINTTLIDAALQQLVTGDTGSG